MLLLAAVGGFLLGGCGGGDRAALTTATDRTVTRTSVTATRPVLTTTEGVAVTTTTEDATTAEATTTEPEPTTTSEPETTTVVQTQTVATTVLPETTTTEPTTTEPIPTETVEPASSEGSSAWGWIVLAIAAGVGIAIAVVLWSRHRAGSASWSGAFADLIQRTFVTLDLVLAQGSVVTGQVEALADAARRLQARAPDDRARARAARLRAHLDELVRVLEADRALRLASPPPSAEQLTYSGALIRSEVQQLQAALRAARGTGTGA